MKKDSRKNYVQIRLNDEEKSALDRKFQLSGSQSKSRFIRLMILEGIIVHFDEEKFNKIVPTQDDIWFWGMAALKGTKIRLNKGYSYNHVTVENTQNVGLCKINNKKNKGISGKDGFNRMIDSYPELLDVLKKY